jgi:hypothetical protein
VVLGRTSESWNNQTRSFAGRLEVDNGSTEAIPNQLAACELTLTWIPSSVFRIDIKVEVVILSSRLGLMNVRAGNMKLHFPK